ncbi:MAG: putative porin [Acidobacteria bacterium]|nr:putative porin [Acidobacteriota bacterium]
MAWLRKLVQGLWPDAETRWRTRYYIFKLITWAAQVGRLTEKEEEQGMKTPIKHQATQALLAAFLFAGPLVAEEAAKITAPPQPLQEQLQQQQQRILELERRLKQQALLLEKLQQMLAEQPTNAPAPAPNSASAAAPALQGVSTAQEVERLSGEVDALAEHNKELQEKVNTLEKKSNDAEKNLGAKVKGLGNFTFSGDVRLRYEPFFGGTLSQDRHRERVRLRFNAIAKFSDELTGGLTIASGDELDPISTNQTLTNFFQRKPIAIDRAFIQYAPNWFKPLTLTGGKFGYTWYRTELTLDNDLNPEGFSQAFSFKFDNPLFKRLGLVGFQLPFRETGSFDDSFLYGGQIQSEWKFGERLKFAGYAAFYNWHRADPVRAAQAAGTLTGSSNANTTAPGDLFASKFALFDVIGRLDVDTGSTRWPLLLQLDFVNNTRACANVSVATCNPKDRSGWWAEVQVGQTKKEHDVNFGYTFIRLEREAVVAAFNFSDLRQPTNVISHRFNFGYQAYRNITLNFTALMGRALQTATSPTAEPWLKRLQFDVVYKF